MSATTIHLPTTYAPAATVRTSVHTVSRRANVVLWIIQAALASFGPPLDNAATARWQFTDLVQRSDDTNWWRVPYEMAPMHGAYAIHELVPIGSGAGRVVTVNFRGLPNSARGADWRASFIVISDTGAQSAPTAPIPSRDLLGCNSAYGLE